MPLLRHWAGPRIAANWNPTRLDEALSDLELAQPAGDEEVVEALVVWTRTSNLYDVEPQDPKEILEKLFADILEVN